MKRRRKRNDRNYILYRLDNVVTGDFYIGLSAVLGHAVNRTLKVRFRRHLSRAFNDGKEWDMHEALRKFPDTDSWKKSVLKVVRGRKTAHLLERRLINRLGPTLNTF